MLWKIILIWDCEGLVIIDMINLDVMLLGM